jgi:hypothetical protein
VTANSEVRRAVQVVVRSLLPYADPRARRKVRAEANALVACSPWRGRQADGAEIAQLALLRLLWLQREAHNAARAGHSESVALLARTAIDTCVVGLYCLVTPAAPAQLSDQNAHQFAAMLRYLPTSFVNERTRKRLVSKLGKPSREPSIWTMVVAVDKAAGDDIAEMLYRAYYTPLSTFYAHGGGLSLLRHVGPGDHVTERPVAPWFHRSALNITDSSAALLATRVARAAGRDSEIFDRYYEAHRSRTITPVFAVGGRGLARAIRWRELPGSLRAMLELRRYLGSGRAAADSPAVREATLRAGASRCFALIRSPDDDEEVFEIFVDGLVEAISAEAPTP